MQFYDHLPPEAHNERYSVLAPEHGPNLKEVMEQLMLDIRNNRATSIIVVAFRDDMTAKVRVIPEPNHVMWNPDEPTMYHIERGVGFFLREDGSDTGNTVDLSLNINTEVTVKGMPSGFLVMWNPGDPSHEFNDAVGE